MGQFDVLKEVYTISEDCDEPSKKTTVNIDDFDPLCSNLPSWTMTPQVSIAKIFFFILDYSCLK